MIKKRRFCIGLIVVVFLVPLIQGVNGSPVIDGGSGSYRGVGSISLSTIWYELNSFGDEPMWRDQGAVPIETESSHYNSLYFSISISDNSVLKKSYMLITVYGTADALNHRGIFYFGSSKWDWNKAKLTPIKNTYPYGSDGLHKVVVCFDAVNKGFSYRGTAMYPFNSMGNQYKFRIEVYTKSGYISNGLYEIKGWIDCNDPPNWGTNHIISGITIDSN